jgi:hypothetical protein
VFVFPGEEHRHSKAVVAFSHSLTRSTTAGHAALHLAYVWAWPSGEAQTLRKTVRSLLHGRSTSQTSTQQPIEIGSTTAGSPGAGAQSKAPCEQSSGVAQPAVRGQEESLKGTAPHVQAVLQWSAAPSWSEKRACSHSNLQVLGTGFDIAVHIAMLIGHVRALGAISS